METRSKGQILFQVDWNALKRLCISSLLPDREVLEEDLSGKVHHHTGDTIAALSSLVSSSDGEPSGRGYHFVSIMGFKIYQCYMQRISRNIIDGPWDVKLNHNLTSGPLSP